MVEDKYEKRDDRTLCERIGHDYKEISCREKRWYVDEQKYSPTEQSGGADFQGAASDYSWETRRTHYTADMVTYQCSRSGCGDIITRKENERID